MLMFNNIISFFCFTNLGEWINYRIILICSETLSANLYWNILKFSIHKILPKKFGFYSYKLMILFFYNGWFFEAQFWIYWYLHSNWLDSLKLYIWIFAYIHRSFDYKDELLHCLQYNQILAISKFIKFH
jgi:hypothetical protein